MNDYTEEERSKDFEFFKNINQDFFSKNGHKFIGIRNSQVIESADDIPELVKKMNEKSFELGSYLLQECTGDESAYKTKIMKLLMKVQ